LVGRQEGVGKVGPGNERGEIKNRIGSRRRELGEAAEEQSEDQHVETGWRMTQENADGGLFCSDLDVAPDEEIEEFAVGPDFAEAKLEEAAGRFDATVRSGAEGDGGWRRGGHAVAQNS